MEDKEIVVTPLGTVSTYCTLDNCCPGYLIKYKDKKILLDCGNGISKYLNIREDLQDLTIIISHLHPDHYGELLSLSLTSYVLKKLGYIKDRIKVYIPEGDKVKTTEHYTDSDGWGASKVVDKNLIDFDYIMSLEKTSYLEIIPYKGSDKLSVDDLKVSFSKNPHPIITYSTKLETDGLKIVYSSDTGYEKNTLVNFSSNADLLICESTFLRGQNKVEDNHLFAYEAGIIAKEANVSKLLLTHFWPSIDKEKYVEEAKEYFPDTEAAEEGKKLILRRSYGKKN